eukprot:CAMPEP_0180516098 /NCGR_PEP_ID=MMETSP1036_2-20121128/53712_1 /TAXON_ID=632150 /ORGANISM="Azadinium spinosum, Strain 3D9" /LENGTH=96 /DNA_ID=CAMNT_0022527825 /DNA_START=1 /DNA_END=287 /DNA_ORIENTATION=-
MFKDLRWPPAPLAQHRSEWPWPRRMVHGCYTRDGAVQPFRKPVHAPGLWARPQHRLHIGSLGVLEHLRPVLRPGPGAQGANCCAGQEAWGSWLRER